MVAMKEIDKSRNGVDTSHHVVINKPFVCLPGSSFGMQAVAYRDLFMFPCANRGRNINQNQIFKFIV